MPRAKKLGSGEAVSAAMALFWKHGYNNLGTRQLEAETGITRFTLQTSYGGKKKLFLSALDFYLDEFEKHVAPNMSDGYLDTIANWFEARADPAMLADVTCYGCLLLNSTVEFAARDEEVNIRAERFFKIMRIGFQRALNAVNQKHGENSCIDADAMSEVLTGAVIGLNIVIRSAGSNAAGKNMATAIASMVRGWGNAK